jgi:hypothetical protein
MEKEKEEIEFLGFHIKNGKVKMQPHIYETNKNFSNTIQFPKEL